MVTQYYTASSVDGFIADSENSLEWLFPNDIDHSGPMAYPGFIAEVGALAMGATTYQWLLDHAAESGMTEPFYEQPTWVFTHRDFPKPEGDVRFVSDDVAVRACRDGRRSGRQESCGSSAAATLSVSSPITDCWMRSGCNTPR